MLVTSPSSDECEVPGTAARCKKVYWFYPDVATLSLFRVHFHFLALCLPFFFFLFLPFCFIAAKSKRKIVLVQDYKSITIPT